MHRSRKSMDSRLRALMPALVRQGCSEAARTHGPDMEACVKYATLQVYMQDMPAVMLRMHMICACT